MTGLVAPVADPFAGSSASASPTTIACATGLCRRVVGALPAACLIAGISWRRGGITHVPPRVFRRGDRPTHVTMAGAGGRERPDVPGIIGPCRRPARARPISLPAMRASIAHIIGPARARSLQLSASRGSAQKLRGRLGRVRSVQMKHGLREMRNRDGGSSGRFAVCLQALAAQGAFAGLMAEHTAREAAAGSRAVRAVMLVGLGKLEQRPDTLDLQPIHLGQRPLRILFPRKLHKRVCFVLNIYMRGEGTGPGGRTVGVNVLARAHVDAQMASNDCAKLLKQQPHVALQDAAAQTATRIRSEGAVGGAAPYRPT